MFFPGPSPAQASDAPAQSPAHVPLTSETNNAIKSPAPSSIQPVPEVNAEEVLNEPMANSQEANKETKAAIMQPIVKLQRISTADQMLIQMSLSDFAETKPKLAKELGIAKKEENHEDSEPEDSPKKTRRKPSEDDDYAPDQFSKLVGK